MTTDMLRAAVLLFLATVLTLAPPLLLGWLYDFAFSEVAAWPRRAYEFPQVPRPDLLKTLAAFGGLTLVAQVAMLGITRARERVVRRAQARLIAEVRVELARKASRLPGRELLTIPTGRMEAVLFGDVDVLEGLLFQGIETFLVAPLAVLGTLIVMLLLGPELTAVALLPLPFLVLAIAARTRSLRILVERERAVAADFTSATGTFLGSLLLARVYGREDREAARLGETARAARWARFLADDTMAAHLSFVAFIGTLAGSGVLLYGGWHVLLLRVTPGVLLAFLNYSTLLYPSLIDMTRANYVLQNVAVAMRRIAWLLDAPEAPRNEGGPVPGDGPLDVRLRGVRFAYEAGRDVLAGVDLDVAPGSRIAISGPSGGGKTTLARVLAGILAPDAGVVLIGGVDPMRADSARFRRRCVMVSQEEMLPGETVAETLRYAREEATDAELEEALRVAGLSQRLSATIGPRGWAVSGGERQRLAIARAVVARPSLLILDEATSAVDLATEAEIHRQLAGTLRDCTIVLITHRTGSVAWVDRHLRLESGRLDVHPA